MSSIIPIIVLLVVFVLIAVRKVGRVRLQIWQIMFGGAIAVLLTLQISLPDALGAINLDVMLFLFGMFVIGRALEQSGYLSHLSYKIFRRAKNADILILLMMFLVGIGSAFLMNDTLAIIGVPVMLLLAKQHSISTKVLLLALAFSVTIGSVMSPIGNPQNLLIVINGGIQNPFPVFFTHLFLPTVINLAIAYLLLKLFYKKEFHKNSLVHIDEPIKDRKFAMLSKASLIILIALIVAKIFFAFIGIGIDFRLTYIALVAMLPILFSEKRFDVIKSIDWHTLIFFVSMFVLMQSVWLSGFFQNLISSLSIDITSIGMILLISVTLSQLISNVPLVALYMPLLVSAGTSSKELVALAAGSTIAGNLFILGAASNVIIVQNAEKYGETITFWDFAKIGFVLTVCNVAVYWVFLVLF